MDSPPKTRQAWEAYPGTGNLTRFADQVNHGNRVGRGMGHGVGRGAGGGVGLGAVPGAAWGSARCGGLCLAPSYVYIKPNRTFES